jgi:hypothetical protein
MTSRFLALAAVAALVAVTAVSAVGPPQPSLYRPVASGTAHLRAFGSRSAQQVQSPTDSKFDGALADIARHLNQVRPDHALQDLSALNPAVRFLQPAGSTGPLVLVDAVTRGDPQQLKAALLDLGMQHVALYSNDVGGWLPVSQLEAAVARGEVTSIRAAMHRTRSGAVTSQGDFAQHSDTVRSANALTGAGVTVGILSDSYDCYAQFAANDVPASGNAGYAYYGFTATAATDISTGDLPSNVNVLEDATCIYDGKYAGYPLQLPLSDEGRAMLQIVYDVAPGASLAFRTGDNSEADFASGIEQLAKPVAEGGAGANVIADDLAYFDEPFFQDGILAQAIDTVESQGVAYFSAAGNDGTLAYNNNNPSFATLSSTAPNAGEHLLNFDTSRATTTTTLPVSIPALQPGDFVAIIVEWDQPYITGAAQSGGSTSALDLCVTNVTGTDQVTDDYLDVLSPTCTGANTIGMDPYLVMLVGNPANGPNMTSAETFNIVLGLVSGSAPGRIKVSIEGDGIPLTINQFATNSPTMQGHPSAAGAAAVGAAFFLNTPACGTASASLEYFSSGGGDPILFDVNGNRLAIAEMRQKPDFVAPDGGNNTFLGYTLKTGGLTDTSTITGCENNASYPNFFGTSAATPHAAGIAALLLQSDPTLTPAQIYSVMQQSALSMNGSKPNLSSGYGFVQADAAEAMITPALPTTPTLTLAASSVTLGSSTTLTWSSANNQGCTASGAWTGALASSGSQTVSPTATGTDSYMLACTNKTGTSSTASATLMVNAKAASSGGGGGGELGLATLLGLGGIFLGRLRRRR